MLIDTNYVLLYYIKPGIWVYRSGNNMYLTDKILLKSLMKLITSFMLEYKDPLPSSLSSHHLIFRPPLHLAGSWHILNFFIFFEMSRAICGRNNELTCSVYVITSLRQINASKSVLESLRVVFKIGCIIWSINVHSHIHIAENTSINQTRRFSPARFESSSSRYQLKNKNSLLCILSHLGSYIRIL